MNQLINYVRLRSTKDYSSYYLNKILNLIMGNKLGSKFQLLRDILMESDKFFYEKSVVLNEGEKRNRLKIGPFVA